MTDTDKTNTVDTSIAQYETDTRVNNANSTLEIVETMRTYLVFLDLPMHIEYRVNDMPLMPEGVVIHFKIDLRHPRNPKRIRKIDDKYKIENRRLIYSSVESGSQGISQYLELALSK